MPHEIFAFAQEAFHLVLDWAALFCEVIAAGVLIVSFVKEFSNYIFGKGHVVLNISKKINVALVFKLVSSLFHLLTATEYKDIFIVGMVVVIHGAISYLINWEIAHDHSNVNPKDLEDVNL